MKAKLLADMPLPGGFIIEAQTPEEVLIMRSFVAHNNPRGIEIAAQGRGPVEGSYSITITYKE